MRVAITALCLSVLIGGCQSLKGASADKAYAIAAGSTLTLNQPVPIRQGAGTIYISSGKPYAGGGFSFSPVCRLQLRSLAPTDGSLPPQSWVVKRSSLERGYFVRAPQRLLYAGSIRGRGGGQPSHVTFATHILFDREVPGDAYRLTCGQLDDGYGDHYLSIDEIQGILGDLITISPRAAQ